MHLLPFEIQLKLVHDTREVRIAPSPDGTIEQLDAIWKKRLEEALGRYAADHSPAD